uniref:U-box domain-containing protein 12 n=1 Tax=Aegilops tauschii TaxID=37682 RepID=M8C6H0_AEGTA
MAAALAWRFNGTNGGADLDKVQDSEPPTPVSVMRMGNMQYNNCKIVTRNRVNMEDEETLSSVAHCIEQLRQSSSSTQEKESSLKQLLDLVQTRDTAFGAVASHSQAVPILVSLLRSGSSGIKMLSATVLGSLCKEEELRVKVLLGGCIPPLLALLRSKSAESQTAAAKTIYAVSQGGIRDHVGSKIFSTENVVPVLWEQLKVSLKNESLVDGLLTGALKNLSKSTEGFWSATVRCGGVDILIKLIGSGQTNTLANVCNLLGALMMEDSSVCSKILSGETTKQLLKLLGPGNETSIRAEAAGALKSLSAQSKEARREVASSNGIPALINATIAPSKEFMHGESAQALQENAMCALANISGGLSYVISSLGESLQSCSSSAQIADTLGALASALMIYDINAESISASDPLVIEKTLMKQFKPKAPFLVQERVIEALASLYSNPVLCKTLADSDAKRLLVGLITMAGTEVQDDLMTSLFALCKKDCDLWQALQGREGVQLLISLLGLSSEQQQECAVALLALLSKENDECKWAITAAGGIPPLVQILETGSPKAKEDSATIIGNLCNHSEDIRACVESARNENDECKWAITAAGGIPPLVQILETGSPKAKEDSATIIGNLCNHSEDIRACVESADAVPALLWLLKNGSDNGKEIASKTLNHLIHKSDTGTISQLSALLTSEQPESKIYVLDALKSLLSVAPLNDILHEGSAANDAVETMIKILSSPKEETQATSASALAGLFHCRKDLRETHIAVKTLWSVMKLIDVQSDRILMEASCCLAAIFLSVKQNKEVAAVGRDALAPLVSLASSTVLEVAEQATRALANLFLDHELSALVSFEEIMFPITRVLKEGTLDGRIHGAAAIARLLQCRPINQAISDTINRSGAVLALAGLLEAADGDASATSEVLDALVLLSRSKVSSGHTKAPWTALAENPHTILPLVSCVADAVPALQDKAIEVLSRLCLDQHDVVGGLVSEIPGCISSAARRVIGSNLLKVKVGGCALLVCAAKEHCQKQIEILSDSSLYIQLIHSLVGMINTANLPSENGDGESIADIKISRHSKENSSDTEMVPHTAVISGNMIPLWLLAVFARHDDKTRAEILEAGAVQMLTEKISQNAFLYVGEEDNTAWVCALLLALLFQEREVNRSNSASHSIPVLSNLLRSDEPAYRYFAAQALASLVSNGSRGTLLAVANSGAATGLISLLGCANVDIADLLELSEEFMLVPNPDETTLERLFRVDDIRVGSTSRKSIPLLVDLLKPIPERPGAPFLALGLLTQLAVDCVPNMLLMAEVGILEALTKYLSLSPQDATEEATTELLGILFSCAEIRQHESALGTVNQLVAVLRLGGRNSRYSAAKALESLFCADHVRNSESARQAIQPLVEVLSTGMEREQHAAISALVRLLCDNPSRALAVADVEMNAVDVLCRILSSDCSAELKGDAAELCGVLFANTRIRSTMAAARCVEPLVGLLVSEANPAQLSVVRALDKLLDDEQLAELVAAHGAVVPLVGLLFGKNFMLHEAVARALVKIGKDRPACKLEMVKAGVIESILDILHDAPDFLCTALAEMLRILTNNASIAKGPSAAKVVQPLFSLLSKADTGPEGQYSTLQQRAIKALANLALAWPNTIAKEGGVFELSKVLLQSDPPLPHVVWESAAAVLSSILQYSTEFFLEVPVAVLVQLLRSGTESTVVGALNALLVLESDDSTSAEAMAESGAVEALLDLLRSHQCEEAAARLIEALLNNIRIREAKAAKNAIAPLSMYLLDPQTQSQQGRLLAALALGDLFQNEGLARSTDAVAACRALVNLLEDQPTEEMKVVAICALQNLVMYSRANKRAVAESGGVQVLLDLISSSNPDTSVQAAMFVKLLFNNHTIQEYATSETVRVITASIEKDIWASGSANEEYLKALNALLSNFPRLRVTEPATICIPHLVTSLKTGSEATQEAALDSLYLLRQAWTACPAEVFKAQSVAASEAIPLLQYLIQSGPPRFQEKAELLLQCLPGTLTVTIKRGNNLRQSVGNASAFCKLTLGNNPARLTKIVSTGESPEWDEAFAWAFDSPPKGQKLHISCKNNSKFGKKSFGKVTIQIDRVVMLGSVAGEYTLLPESKSGPNRNLEIEFQWSNK